jgi:hypothetical protein
MLSARAGLRMTGTGSAVKNAAAAGRLVLGDDIRFSGLCCCGMSVTDVDRAWLITGIPDTSSGAVNVTVAAVMPADPSLGGHRRTGRE